MNDPKFGVYDMSNEEYHASDGLSRSALWLYKENAYKYWYQYLSGKYERPKEGDALRMGSLIHLMILEPELFHEKYIVKPALESMPEGLLLKDVGRELFEQRKEDRAVIKQHNDACIAEFEMLKEGRAVVSDNDVEVANACRDSVLSKPECAKLLSNIRAEKSIYWTDHETGILCKARPDAWSKNLVIDLKSSVNSGYRYFQSAAAKQGYFLQAGMIYEGMKTIGQPIKKFVFIVVEKEAPYSVGTYVLDDEALQYGIDLFHALLRKYAVSRETEQYSDYGLQVLMAPKYVLEDLKE